MAYKQTISDKIIGTLKDNLGSSFFKQYYNGDPIAIPQSLMPCIVVEKQGTNIEAGPTQMDDVTYTIVVKVIFNKKDDFGKRDDEANTQRKLEDIVEGIDETTGQWDTRSILGILRKNFTLENEITDQVLEVNYGLAPRPQDVVTAEANIMLTIRDILVVSGRS